jgi:hypothetical protein
MKLTKSKLNQLIKEELQAVLSEIAPGVDPVTTSEQPLSPNILGTVEELIKPHIDKLLDEHVKSYIEGIVDERIAMHGNLTEQVSDRLTLESVDQMARQNKLQLDWIHPAVAIAAKKLNIGIGET